MAACTRSRDDSRISIYPSPTTLVTGSATQCLNSSTPVSPGLATAEDELLSGTLFVFFLSRQEPAFSASNPRSRAARPAQQSRTDAVEVITAMAVASVRTKFVLFKAKPLNAVPYEPYETLADDVLLAGSSDEDTEQDRQRKRQRREDACQFYLRHGQPKLISTARLRGPFEPHHVAKPKKRKVRTEIQGQNGKMGEIPMKKTNPEDLLPAAEHKSSFTRDGQKSQAGQGVSKDRKQDTASIDSPSLHLPVVDPLPSSPTPIPRSVVGRRKRGDGKQRGREKEKPVQASPCLKRHRGADDTIKLNSPPTVNVPSHKQDRDCDIVEVQANCTNSPSRQPLRITDSNVRSKARKQNLRSHAVSISAQSPFQYVPTRLLRRQKQQLEQLMPEEVSVEEDEVKSLGKQSLRGQQNTEASSDSHGTTRHVLSVQSSGLTGSTKHVSVAQQLCKDELAQEGVSMLPPQVPTPGHLQGDGNLQMGTKEGKRGSKDTRTEEADNPADAQAASSGASADEPQGNIQADTGTQSSNAAATATDQTVSNPRSGQQDDGQQVSAPKPSTEVFETEKPLLESRKSQAVLSTQVAFSDALAGLYTPNHASGAAGQSQRMILSSKKRRSNARVDNLESQDLNLGTQALLAKAPRFSISPDLCRSTGSVKIPHLPSAPDVEDTMLPETVPPVSRPDCKVANSPRTEDTGSFINLLQSHHSSLRGSEATGQTPEQTSTLNASFRKLFESMSSSRHLARPESESHGRKRKRVSNKMSATQPSSSDKSQGVLTGHVTKPTSSTASLTKQKKGESAWSDLKTSRDWQDAQRDRELDVFKQADAGMMDDDTLDETIRDIEGFLGSWTSDLESKAGTQPQAQQREWP